ncbi:MAG: hypothetical protein L0G99_08750, partial [Propionibacteriales bacterium]|nr:hypothetical protein [Propionibacteriales bacterium]
MTRVSIGLAGTHGFGEYHLARLARLQRSGRVELIGVADPAGAGPSVPVTVPVYRCVADLLAAGVPD